MKKEFEWLKWFGLSIVVGILVAVAYLKGENDRGIKENVTLRSLIPTLKINKGNNAFVDNYMPQIEQQCSGLIKYKDDWNFEEITDRGFTIIVADKPKNEELIEFRSFRNRCFFDLSKDGRTVSIPKRACASLCKDQLIDNSNYKINVKSID
ncbi:MAG: hypothetical protein O2793_16850 [Proteobacteria bacterium]|nr:hypothetical protein [Pseudomonadota bacterium]MDA1255973.1 hypothetical protein [Pseudomonadota bacterium]